MAESGAEVSPELVKFETILFEQLKRLLLWIVGLLAVKRREGRRYLGEGR